MITVILAGAGYVINDLMDVSTDTINKSLNNKVQKLGQLNVYFFYVGLNLIALLLSIFVSWKMSQPAALVIFFLNLIFLYWYSAYLKSTILWGNLLVSFFLSMVPLFFFWVDLESFQVLKMARPSAYQNLMSYLIGFSVFAFLSNLIREVVKDAEDIAGDQIAGLTTLPICYGLRNADGFIMGTGLLMLFAGVYWIYHMALEEHLAELIAFVGLVMIPMLAILTMIIIMKEHKKYRWASSILKIVMILGLVYLILFVRT